MGKLGTCLGRQRNKGGTPHQEIKSWQQKTLLIYSIHMYSHNNIGLFGIKMMGI